MRSSLSGNERFRMRLKLSLFKERLDLAPQLRDLDAATERVELDVRKAVAAGLDGDAALLPSHVTQKVNERIERAVKKNPAMDARHRGARWPARIPPSPSSSRMLYCQISWSARLPSSRRMSSRPGQCLRLIVHIFSLPGFFVAACTTLSRRSVVPCFLGALVSCCSEPKYTSQCRCCRTY